MANQASKPARTATPAAERPAVRLCEGTRDELERTGKATDPFTGRKLTRDDLPK